MNIAFANVSKSYGPVHALQDFSLDIPDGELMVLLGPSGSGKSTVLNLAAGLERPDAGQVIKGSRVVNDLEPKDRNVAMVFQTYALYPHMTCFENIAFPLRIRKVPAAEIAQRVRSIATVLRVDDLLDRKPNQLSGGEAQRVCLGRALVRTPDLFLLDEPLSNLDAKLRVTMRTEIQCLCHEMGITAMYITHDQEEAMAIGQRVAVLNQGCLQQVGTPLEVFDNPENLFVARFVGNPTMNTFEGVVIGSDIKGSSPWCVATKFFTINLPEVASAALPATENRQLVLGIRPRCISLVVESEGEALFSGRVVVIEHMGEESHVYVEAAGCRVVVVVEASRTPKIGDIVSMRFNPGKVYLFDAGTGRSLCRF